MIINNKDDNNDNDDNCNVNSSNNYFKAFRIRTKNIAKCKKKTEI